MPFIDAHQHLWDLSTGGYQWIGPGAEPLNRTFTADEAQELVRDAGIDGVILVQADDTKADTEAMFAHANARDWVVGVVGWVPLLDPAVTRTTLARWQQEPTFCGSRSLIHDQPDPDWVLQRPVLDSLRVLAQQKVPFDLVAVLDRHLEHVPTLVSEVEGLRIVIDHLAKPPIKEGQWEPWATHLARAAASSDQVYAKVSGLNTAADPLTWNGESLRPYVEYAIERFGADRLLFGTDWPVALMAGTYEQVLQETHVALANCTAEERDAILGGTAANCYGLQLPESEAAQ